MKIIDVLVYHLCAPKEEVAELRPEHRKLWDEFKAKGHSSHAFAVEWSAVRNQVLRNLDYQRNAPVEPDPVIRAKHREFWDYCCARGLSRSDFVGAWHFATRLYPESLNCKTAAQLYDRTVTDRHIFQLSTPIE